MSCVYLFGSCFVVRSVAQNHYRFLYSRIITNTGTGDPRDEKTLQLLWRHALEPPMNALPTTLRYGCMKLWSVAKSFNVKNVDPDEEEKKAAALAAASEGGEAGAAAH